MHSQYYLSLNGNCQGSSLAWVNGNHYARNVVDRYRSGLVVLCDCQTWAAGQRVETVSQFVLSSNWYTITHSCHPVMPEISKSKVNRKLNLFNSVHFDSKDDFILYIKINFRIFQLLKKKRNEIITGQTSRVHVNWWHIYL